MKQKFEFSLGDKFTHSDGSEYEIKEWRVVKDKSRITVSYSFHAYSNKHFDYHQFITEDNLLKSSTLSCKEAHPVEIELDETDVNDETVEIGDKIFTDIYSGDLSTLHIFSPTLTFAAYCYVNSLCWFQTTASDIYCEIVTTRIGLCNKRNGEPWYDARRDGTTSSEFLKFCIKHADQRFIDAYMKTLNKNKYFIEELLEDKTDYAFEVRWLLNEMGVLDKVLERIFTDKTKKPVKNPIKIKKFKTKTDVDWKSVVESLAKKAGVSVEEFLKTAKE